MKRKAFRDQEEGNETARPGKVISGGSGLPPAGGERPGRGLSPSLLPEVVLVGGESRQSGRKPLTGWRFLPPSPLMAERR
jgi:hypothetical protein